MSTGDDHPDERARRRRARSGSSAPSRKKKGHRGAPRRTDAGTAVAPTPAASAPRTTPVPRATPLPVPATRLTPTPGSHDRRVDVTSTPAPHTSTATGALSRTGTPLAPPRRTRAGERPDPRVQWAERFAERLPEVAQRAAGKVARELINALAARVDLGMDDAVLEELDERLDRLAACREDARRWRDTLRQAAGLGPLRSAMIEVLREMTGGKGLAGDRRALRRNLDVEAIEDRILRREHGVVQPVELLCLVVGAAARLSAERGRVVRVERRLLRLARDASYPWTLREAAIRAIGSCASSHDDAGSALSTLRELAEDATQDPWVQAAALGTWLQLSPTSTAGFGLLRRALDPTAAASAHPDHAFFRARAVGLAVRRQAWVQLREAARRGDPSEHVRIATVRGLASSPSRHDTALLLDLISGTEQSPRVRAAAALAAIDVGVQPRIGIRVVRDILRTDASVVSIVLSGLHYRQRPDRLSAEVAKERLAAWRPSLEAWRDDEQAHADLRVDAAAVILSLEVAADPELAQVWRAVDEWAISASEGEVSSLATSLDDEERLLDILALVAQHTQDLGATRTSSGYRLFHGARPRPTVWRFVHEVFHPRPDKRQAFSHLVDRVPRGRMLAPSGCVAEVTRTTVPGRPVSSPTERWWGPDLPLPSWMIAASRRGAVDVRALPDVRLTLSAKPLGRAIAPAAYVRLAELREAARQAPREESHTRYDQALDKAGFEVRRHGLGLAGAGALPVLDSWLGGIVPTARELLALDGNSLPQLAVFSVLVGAGWATTAALRQQRARAARARLPLVIGGWGSRGKSGVERLKAAIFHELGYPVLSKTTGNEAMVVVGLPGREPVEVFLYRPYDRASIVEQRETLHLADRLGVQVLLWECMALNPRYVEILQQDWMRDDLTTITNTYPDHEDIQGPSGLDVARSIACVLPRHARAVTAEQAMTPVLAEEARRRDTQLDALSPEAWDLLPEDVLSRFPYDEHPRNIALVVAMARTLGIRSDVALRAMADKVVPDLGVLKEYGPARIRGREVSFIVGNSANERAGFLSNWQRMGFDARPDGAGLLDLTALVVNNRRDRLARQAVFARVAALDAPVDRMVVIGTNVRPFVRAYEQALQDELRPRWLERLATPELLVERMAARLRRPLLDVDGAAAVLERAWPERAWPDQVRTAVQAAFDRASVDAPPQPIELRQVEGAADAWLAEVAWLAACGTGDAALSERVVDGAIDLLRARTLAIQDPDIAGEAITRAVVATVPEGCRLRMLGAANIKGTGLDLVYGWVQVERVRGLLDEVLGGEPTRAASALRTLTSLELSAVDRTIVRERLEAGLDRLQDTETRLLAEQLLAGLGAEAVGTVRVSGQAVPWLRRSLRRAVANVDLDAVVRRRAADRLYSDLGRGRVGLERAATVAKGLVSRQKVP